MCFGIINRIVAAESLLECAKKEGNNRISFYLSHAIKAIKRYYSSKRYYSVLIASLDRYIFVAATHYFNNLKNFSLKEWWFV